MRPIPFVMDTSKTSNECGSTFIATWVKAPSSSIDWKGTWFLFVSITQLPKCLLLNVNGICIYGIQWSAVQFFVSEWWIIWVVITSPGVVLGL